MVRVEVEPYCQAGIKVRPVWVQVQAGELNLVKDLVEPGSGGTADSEMPGCVAAVAVAIAAVASGVVPKEIQDV